MIRVSKSSKRLTRELEMDKRIKTAQKKMEKVEKKEFKGLLKEDKKLDKQRDMLKKKVSQKGC